VLFYVKLGELIIMNPVEEKKIKIKISNANKPKKMQTY
jgi:hypothetical protein